MNAALRRWLTNPGVLFALGWALLLAVLFAPLLAGGVIVNPLSDGKDGYVTRHFAATVIAAWGEIPRWDPYIFGGQPFLGAMYGDQAYPISIILRAIFPPALGIGLGMVLHLWLGAVGMLVFLRRLRHQWTSAIVGATAYGLGGPLIGLLFPGHDGKIFVLGLLPWGLTAILAAARTAKPVAFAGWGTIAGLMLLSPHFQMMYYFSMLAGAWVLFLLFTETPRPMRWRFLAGMTIGSVGGLLLAGAQLLPFIDYLPFSPRSAGGSTSGWEFATSWPLPALELVGTAWGGFNGWQGWGGWLGSAYWGSNYGKLHSDYLGLLVVVLAVTAVWGGLRKASPDRRITWFWFGAIIFGTLWALAGQTPFYRFPYTFFPGISKTRAAGMIWGHVSACVAVLAAMGFARIQATSPEDRSRWAKRALIIAATAAAFLALAAPGMIRALSSSQRFAAAVAAVPGAQWGILLGGFTVAAFALVAWRAPRWLPHAAVLLIATDLIIQDKRFIVIDPRGAGVFAPDQVVQALQRDATGTAQPWRIVPLNAYMDDYLIEHRIRSVLGYHGNEQHRYDELLGGKNVWSRLGTPLMWRHLAVRYVLTNRPLEVPGLLEPVVGPAVTWLGDTAWAYRVVNPSPWAHVVPVAFRASDEDVHQLVVAPQFDPDRAVLVPRDAPFGTDPAPQQVLPPAFTPPVNVTVTERQPGVYVLALEGLTQEGVLVVSENWLPSWKATVDGRPAPVARANGTFIAVPVPARSREVVLSYDSLADRRGRMASFAGLGGLLILALAGVRLKKPAQAA